jgi:hypothetical protein
MKMVCLLAQSGMVGPEGLLIAIVTSAVCFAWVLIIIHHMAEGEIGANFGLPAIGIAVALMPVAIMSGGNLVTVAVFVAMLAGLVLLPFAKSASDARIHRLTDTDELVRAYNAFGARPDNVGARFEIARIIKRYGMNAHAIAIADRAAASVSDSVDPTQNRSARDLFYKEIALSRRWREELDDAPPAGNLKCPRCQAENPPGEIVCQNCKAPFLLDIVRNSNAGEKLTGRIVLGILTVALLIVSASYAGVTFKGGALYTSLICIIATAGIALGLIFWRKPIA